MAPDKFDVETYQKLSSNLRIGKELNYKQLTSSTMNDACEGALNGAIHGTAYLSEAQTAGRGSGNNTFESKTSGNIYISYVYHKIPENKNIKTDLLSMHVSAALGVYFALKELGIQGLNIKYLNDIWTRGHKLAGILVENKGPLPESITKSLYGEDKEDKYIFIIGIGINVNQDMLRHPTMHSIATSIKCELDGITTNREQLLYSINKSLGDFLPLSQAEVFQLSLAHQLFHLGDVVNVLNRKTNQTYMAELLSFNKDWSVSLKDRNNDIILGFHVDISLRPQKMFNTYIYGGDLAIQQSALALLHTCEALQDGSKVDIRLLNQQQFLQVQWNEKTDLLVLGECAYKSSTSAEMSKLLQHVASLMSSGIQVLACGNIAYILQHFLENKNMEFEDKWIENHATLFRICVGNENFHFYGSSFSKPYKSLDLMTNSFVHGSSENDKTNIVAVIEHGKGRALLIGFNIEITKHYDGGSLSQDVNNLLLKTVFIRDKCLKSIFSYLSTYNT